MGAEQPSHDTRPQRAAASASFTFETNVPVVAVFASSVYTRAGFEVTTTAESPAPRARAVTCSAGSAATSIHSPALRTR